MTPLPKVRGGFLHERGMVWLYEAEESCDGNGLRHGNHIKLFKYPLAIFLYSVRRYIHKVSDLHCRFPPTGIQKGYMLISCQSYIFFRNPLLLLIIIAYSFPCFKIVEKTAA